MTERYNCGCFAALNDAGEYLNGSYATWEEWNGDIDIGTAEEVPAECYGTLCNFCIPRYDAKICKLGGEPLEKLCKL